MSFKAAILVNARTNWGHDVTYSVSYIITYQGKSEKKNIGFSPKGQYNHTKKIRSHVLQTSIRRAAKAGSFMFSVNRKFKRNNLAIFSKSVHFVLVYVKIPVLQE